MKTQTQPKQLKNFRDIANYFDDVDALIIKDKTLFVIGSKDSIKVSKEIVYNHSEVAKAVKTKLAYVFNV